MTDNNTETELTFDEKYPVATAGALPSSRTESMLQEALDNDDPEQKNAQLKHVWSHYQSLEFALADVLNRVDEVKEIITNQEIAPEDVVDFIVRFYRMAVLEDAYQAAHQTGLLVGLGIANDVPDALRQIYEGLDFTDPERAEAVDVADAKDSE